MSRRGLRPAVVLAVAVLVLVAGSRARGASRTLVGLAPEGVWGVTVLEGDRLRDSALLEDILSKLSRVPVVGPIFDFGQIVFFSMPFEPPIAPEQEDLPVAILVSFPTQDFRSIERALRLLCRPATSGAVAVYSTDVCSLGFLDANTLAVTDSPEGLSQLRSRHSPRSQQPLSEDLSRRLKDVDHGALYGAFVLPVPFGELVGPYGVQALPVPFHSIRAFRFALSLDDGLAFRSVCELGTAGDARRAVEYLEAENERVRDSLKDENLGLVHLGPLLGALLQAYDEVHYRADGADVVTELSLSSDHVEDLRKGIRVAGRRFAGHILRGAMDAPRAVKGLGKTDWTYPLADMLDSRAHMEIAKNLIADYRTEHGAFPASLADLSDVFWRTVESPDALPEMRTSLAEVFAETKTRVRYAGRLPSSVAGDTVIAYAYEEGERRFVMFVLTVGGEVTRRATYARTTLNRLRDSYDEVVEKLGDSLTAQRRNDLRDFYLIEE